MNIIGLAPFYPTEYRPELGVFIHSLFAEMRRQGHTVEVIAPLPLEQRILDPLVRQRTDISWIESEILLRPLYPNLLLHLFPCKAWARQRTQQYFNQVVARAFNKIHLQTDWVYAHFLQAGLSCVDICSQRRVPCIVGLGESNLEIIEQTMGTAAFVRTLQSFAGIIAVSRENERFCRDRCPGLGERLIYIPNGVDTTRFHPRDRDAVRKQLGLPPQESIALFCGHFLERKGPLRVQEALNQLPDVHGVFLGQGKQVPRGDRVLYAGTVTHDQIPLWFAAADVFVLPSLAEGMSNAILEALASGLPLVVSDRTFNRDFLTADCAIFVDPFSAESIALGLKTILYDSAKKADMSRRSLELSRNYSLSRRVHRIFDFYHCQVNKGK